MRTLLALIALSACALAQSPAPTYIGAGAAFNQIGTPRWNLWAAGIYPVVPSVGLYTSTTTDIIPVQRFDIATQRQYWAFTTSIRQGVHKQLLKQGRFVALIGGDAGVGMNQAQPSGVAISLAGSFTATGVWQLSDRWAIVVPIGGVWINSSWNLLPKIGIVFKP